MQKLAELCVRRPVFASVLALALVVIGFASYFRLGVDRFPKVDIPTVAVTTRLDGAAAEELETEVTDKIEEAVNTISGIDDLQSTSSEGVSLVTIAFQLEKDGDVAAQEVRDKVNLILSDLPKGIDSPIVEKFDPDASPVLSIALSAERPLREITEFADKTLRRQIESTSGVGQVSLVGGRQRQVNVWLDPEKLNGYGLTVADATRALQDQNLTVPGGDVEQGARDVTLRTKGRVHNVAEFNDVVLANRDGHSVKLADAGYAEDGAEKAESIANVDGKPAVILNVRKQSGTNTVAVIAAVKERLAEIQQRLPRGYRMEVVRDQSIFIEAATHAVQEHLVLGGFLAALVVLLFLGNIRSTAIAAIAIPASIIATFALMGAMGFTLNVLTLLALTLAVGIVIDDAIVVLENIFHSIESKKMTPFEAAIEGTREIGLAVLATTLSLVAVFLPVAFMGGIVGRFMNSFGLTMAFSILVSLFVSFTLTPSLSARWLRRAEGQGAGVGGQGSGGGGQGSGGRGQESDVATSGSPTPDPRPLPPDPRPLTPKANLATRISDAFYRPIDAAYTWLLGQAMKRRWAVVVVCAVALGSIGPLGKAVPKNFLPEDDESQFEILVRAPEGTSLKASEQIINGIAKETRALDGVAYTMVTVAGDAAKTPNQGTIYVRLRDIEERKHDQNALMAEVREQVLPKFDGRDLRLGVQPVPTFGGSGDKNATIQYVLNGPDIKELNAYSEQAFAKLKAIPGVVDADTSLVLGKPELSVTVDRARAADLGVQPSDVANTLKLLVGGEKATDYEEAGEQYDVWVRALPQYRVDAKGIQNITVPSSKLGSVSLDQVVRFDEGIGPASIKRYARQRQVTLTANVKPGASQAAILTQLEKDVKGLGMKPGYSARTAGTSKELGKAASSFLLAFVLSVVFMYLNPSLELIRREEGPPGPGCSGASSV